jgi:hypothetical protein
LELIGIHTGNCKHATKLPFQVGIPIVNFRNNYSYVTQVVSYRQLLALAIVVDVKMLVLVVLTAG